MSPKKMHLVGGFSPTPLKNDGVSSSTGVIVPNIWKKQNHAPNHQPECGHSHMSSLHHPP